MDTTKIFDANFPGNTAEIGIALLAAPVMRPWPPTLEEARNILNGEPYEILDRIGHGGMGAVFKVRNLEPGMSRIEAVKIRRPEARDDDLFRERFLQEIGTLAQLCHPGITAIYRSGDSAEGYLWFSMEFLEGQSLAELLVPGISALSPERVLDITRQLCVTLQFIHKAGRLHRDLKPANVMICEDGSVRLLDFGIARSTEPSAIGILTRPGESPYTPDYAAPEQRNGGPVDERTDLYGLGRIITEMIRPDRSTSRDRPTTYPQRLLDLVDDLLAFDQQQRPGSATDVFEKLGQIEPGSPGFWGKDRCPFRGLEAYQPEHAEIFFGRDAAIRRGMEIILSNSQNPWNGFLFIMGASGSGKSSLARAGLGPALLRERNARSPESKTCFPIICDLGTIRPENECLLPPLARCLAGAIPGTDPQALAAALSHPGSDFAALLEITPDESAEIRLCLILDQFEHFFRTALPRNAQTRFLTAIGRLSRVPGLVVLVTMRSDFYHCCASHPVLMDLKEDRQLDLAPPQPWELAAMLRLSARASDLRFETLPDGSSLDDILLDHARRNPQTLPLLSYMLDQLWEHRDKENGLLRVSDYEALGGFEGAVSAKATETFARFSEDYPESPDAALDKIFRLLVETSDSSAAPAFVRRFATREELDVLDPAVRHLADRFVASRLFVITGDGDNSGQGLTLAHECLLRVWPRAIAWAERNRDFLLTRSRIAVRMREGSPLLQGDPLLVSAKAHLASQSEAFAPDQIEFIRDATVEAEKNMHRATRRRQLASTLLSLLTLVSLLGGAIAWKMKTVADEQSVIAEKRRAETMLERSKQEELFWTVSRLDHEAALQAAGEGRHSDSLALFDRALRYRPENNIALAASAAQAFRTPAWRTRSLTTFEHPVTNVEFSPDGRYFVAVEANKILRVIESATGKEISNVMAGISGTSDRYSPDGQYIWANSRWTPKNHTSVEFSPDGHHLAVAFLDGAVRLIEVATGKELRKLEIKGIPNVLKFNTMGSRLIMKSFGMAGQIIETATGKDVSNLPFSDNVTLRACSPDGRYLALRSSDTKLIVIEEATNKELSKLSFNVGVGLVIFSPDGRYLAVSGDSHGLGLFESATGKEIVKIDSLKKNIRVEFSPDSRYFSVGSWVRDSRSGMRFESVRVYESATGEDVRELSIDTNTNLMKFSPDGRHIVTTSWDKTGQVIEVSTGNEVNKLSFDNMVTFVRFSPDGRRFVAEGLGLTGRVIDVATGKDVNKLPFGTQVSLMTFSPDGCYLAVGLFDKSVRVIETMSSVDTPLDALGSPLGSSKVCYTTTVGYVSEGGAIIRIPKAEASPERPEAATWTEPKGSGSAAWSAALRTQSCVQLLQDGKRVTLLPDELLAAHREVTSFIESQPQPHERWQHAILKWSRMTPENRTTSPWSDEPIRIAVGSRLMRMTAVPALADCAEIAPWHPLEPLSLARLEPRPVVSGVDPASAEPTPDEPRPSAPAGVKSKAPSAPTGLKVESAVEAPPPIQPTDPATREAMMIRPRFFAKLTLKRLREVDEKLYGRDTLAEYAAWSAKIMHEELQLDPEALEAVNFALERTPKDKQQPLLDLKEKLSSADK